MKNKGIRKREGFAGQQLIVIPKKIIADFLTKDLVTKQIYITDIGYYPKALHHYAERAHGISQDIIIYCVEGKGWVEINKKRVDVTPSQFITIPANMPHKYGANEEDPWTIYWIHFKGDISAYIVDLILQNSKNYKPHLSFNKDRIKLFEEIYYNLQKGYSWDNLRYVNMTFYYFLSSLLYEDKFNAKDNKDEKDAISQTIELMQQKIFSQQSLIQFAKFAQLSVSHFSVMFLKSTGYSPIEYFNHLKIQKACEYLTFSDTSIKEIALMLGIEDPYYFSRLFSKLMGISPANYRKRNKQM